MKSSTFNCIQNSTADSQWIDDLLKWQPVCITSVQGGLQNYTKQHTLRQEQQTMLTSKSKNKNNSSLLFTSRFLFLSCSALLHCSLKSWNSKDIASSWTWAKNCDQDKAKGYHDLYRGVNVFFIDSQRSSDRKTLLEMLSSQTCLKPLSYTRLLTALGQALKISKDSS